MKTSLLICIFCVISNSSSIGCGTPDDKNQREANRDSPWKFVVLGAKQMALPGVPKTQLIGLYGSPSFQDNRGNLWYQLTDAHFKGYSKEVKNKLMGGFVVFYIEHKKLKKVRIVSVQDFSFKKKNDE